VRLGEIEPSGHCARGKALDDLLGRFDFVDWIAFFGSTLNFEQAAQRSCGDGSGR